MKSSGIGGQAVIEGVMMKNKDKYAIAVRKPDNEIAIEIKDYVSISQKHPILKLPIIRGVAAFLESMVIGVKTLTYSASFYEEDEKENNSTKKQDKNQKSKAKIPPKKAEWKEKFFMGATVMFSVALAISIFMILPYFISQLLSSKISSSVLLALIEGVIRILLFVGYVTAISQMKDIKRVFMYHGAEHKTINCIERGLDLTVANVKRQSKQHKRCGTSFLLVVMMVSVIFFIFIKVESTWMRVIVRLLLVPVIAGVAYEFIRFAGRSSSPIIEFLSKPGMLLQRMTTREPDNDMIEVAICSVDAVFDWKSYLEEGRAIRRAERDKRRGNTKPRKGKQETKISEDFTEAAVTNVEEPSQITGDVQDQLLTASTNEDSDLKAKPLLDETNKEVSTKAPNAPKSNTRGSSKKKSVTKEEEKPVVNAEPIAVSEEEDDEILKALDKYFISDEENKKE